MPSTHSLPPDIPHATLDQRVANFKNFISLQNDQIAHLRRFIDSYANPDNVQNIIDRKVNRIDELEIQVGKLFDYLQLGVDAIEEYQNDVESLVRELERKETEIERSNCELERNKCELEHSKSEIAKLREDAAAKQQRIGDLEGYVKRLEGIAAATDAERRGRPGHWAVHLFLGSRF
ncbi:hypothetical protein K440DRAFT_611318 [Wilcoxina mikolae CBS 423.85]|nr:hypothetical protein K440DRAFT_611318 [Wilcoxina mikolae CBS 423.85]